MNFEILGFIAGVIVAFSLSPQLIKSWTTKRTKDISLTWTSIYAFGLFLWVIYGFGIKNYPIFIMMGIEFLMALTLLFLKIKYK